MIKFKFFLAVSFLIGAFLGVLSVSAATVGSANNLGLVGYWPLDEGRGTSVGDMSGKGNNGSIIGSPVWSLGNRSRALRFDGVDDNIQVPSSSSLNPGPDMTMAAWVYWAGGTGDKNIITKESSYEMRVNGGYVNYATTPWDWRGGTSSPVSQNQWAFVAVTNDADGLQKIYINGVEKFSYSSGGAIVSNTNPLEIASRYTGTINFFNGLIDEPRVYNRVLSADEILKLYQTGAVNYNVSRTNNPLTSSLVGHWTFDGKSLTNTTALDLSVSGNNGSLVDGAVPGIGRIGQSIKLNGLNSRVHISDVASLKYVGGDMTISLWTFINPSETGGATIVSKPWNGSGQYNYRITLTAARRIQINLYADAGFTSALSTNALTVGEWHNIILKLTTDKKVQVFIDGNLEINDSHGFTNWVPGSGDSNVFLCLGSLYPYGSGWAGNTSFSFDGAIDDVRIYNRSLTSAEMRTLYQSAAPSSNNVGVSPSTNRYNNGLVGHWTFDGKNLTTATATDSSGAGNSGTLFNTPKPVIGKIGQGLSFDGVNEYVLTPNMRNNFANETVTFSTWFKANGAGVILDELGDSTTTAPWHDSQIEVLATGEVKVRVWSLTAVSLGTVNFGEWHHVVLRYNKATSNLDGFLDGVEAATDISGDRQAPWEASYGQYYALGLSDTTKMGSGSYFNGSLDDVRIYNRALSASEILALYNATKSGKNAP